MTLSADLRTLMVAHDAEESGAQLQAATLRLSVEVEFERTRHTHGFQIDPRLGREERQARREGWGTGFDWHRMMRDWNNPAPRHALPWRRGREYCGESYLRFDIPPVADVNCRCEVTPRRDYGGGAITPQMPYLPVGDLALDASGDVVTTAHTVFRSRETQALIDAMARPPVYRPPAVSREVYDTMKRRGLIHEPRARRPSKAERRLARRNRSRK